MSTYNTKWLIFAGTGVAAVLFAVWDARQVRRREAAAGTHASFVPVSQARTEARRTRQALVHSSAYKGSQ
jgi:hypothetical protein